MNILIDKLPTTVIIDGAEYEINSDFRTSILFDMLMHDNGIENEDKILRAVELYYPIIPYNMEDAIDKMLWFYRCGKDNINKKSSKISKVKSNKHQQIYSFEHDDIYIYSAFLDQYGVDLQDIEYMHWWKFKAMFNSLREENKIVQIISYRATPITNEMTKEQKKFYSNMKKEYEIPISDDELEKINAIEEALLKGEDVSILL